MPNWLLLLIILLFANSAYYIGMESQNRKISGLEVVVGVIVNIVVFIYLLNL